MSFTSELRSPQELRQTIRQLARLVEISVTINSTLDTDRLLQRITDTAAELIACETAVILLYDEHEQALTIAATSGRGQKTLLLKPIPLVDTIAGTIFTQEQALVFNDLTQEARRYSPYGEHLRFNTRSLLGVPLRLRDRPIGVLEAINKHSEQFSSTDVRLLSVLASQAAVAIDNARLVQALQRANEQLRQANQLKSDFLAIASHELRTPLGVILGYASFLKEESPNELSAHAEQVLNSALRLNTLVEDMTNLNQLQLGTSGLHLSNFPLQDVIIRAYRLVRPAMEAKSQKVALKMPRLPLIVHGDLPKLELVFTNLLNNAARFSPVGSPISISARGTRDKALVEVSDCGPGIPVDQLEHIFQAFYQAEDHLTRRSSGLGIGLAIAKGIVELHGGRIWAENRKNGPGAVFRLALPLAPNI